MAHRNQSLCKYLLSKAQKKLQPQICSLASPLDLLPIPSIILISSPASVLSPHPRPDLKQKFLRQDSWVLIKLTFRPHFPVSCLIWRPCQFAFPRNNAVPLQSYLEPCPAAQSSGSSKVSWNNCKLFHSVKLLPGQFSYAHRTGTLLEVTTNRWPKMCHFLPTDES